MTENSNIIAIFGAGGLGREVALLIEEINVVRPDEWKLVGFFDDGKVKGDVVDGYPVLGGLKELNQYNKVHVVIAVADVFIRKKIVTEIINTSVRYPTIVHPSVQLGAVARNTIGEGCIITAGTILTTNIRIDDFVIINLSCTIGHDVTIGAFSSLMPGCRISGFIETGKHVMIGTGACVLPKVKLGEGCVVGAGAVVTKDVAAATTVVGIPAKVISSC